MPTRILLADIIAAVARAYKMKPKDLRRKSNEREYVEPRQVAIYLARTLTRATLPQIGRELGKHHSTIYQSYVAVVARRTQDTEYAAWVDRIATEIRAARAPAA